MSCNATESLWKQESELDRDVREHYFGGSMNCKQ